MTNEINPNLIRKLQKMLKLAKDARTSEGDANAALNIAQELMREHNLTMAQVEGAGGQAEGRSKEENKLKSLMYPWRRDLLEVCAKVNFCYVQFTERQTKGGEWIKDGYILIGRKSNTVSTINMFDYLVQTIERLVIEEVGNHPGQRQSRYAFSFRVGMKERLSERLQDRHQQAMDEQARKAREANAQARHPSATPGTALVVVLQDYARTEADLNNDMLNGYEAGTTAKRRLEREARWAKEAQEEKAREAELIASGVSAALAHYMARGMSREKAEELCRPETAAERKKRERADERYWRSRDNAKRREEARYDKAGLRAGYHRGADVGLDGQIDRSKKHLLN